MSSLTLLLERNIQAFEGEKQIEKRPGEKREGEEKERLSTPVDNFVENLNPPGGVQTTSAVGWEMSRENLGFDGGAEQEALAEVKKRVEVCGEISQEMERLSLRYGQSMEGWLDD